MSGTGVVYKDLTPFPEVTEPDRFEKSYSTADEPTASHALANADHDLKGVAQLDHDDEVKDLGWYEAKDKIPAPLVGGIGNEELWLLVRRFDKVCIFLHSVAH